MQSPSMNWSDPDSEDEDNYQDAPSFQGRTAPFINSHETDLKRETLYLPARSQASSSTSSISTIGKNDMQPSLRRETQEHLPTFATKQEKRIFDPSPILEQGSHTRTPRKLANYAHGSPVTDDEDDEDWARFIASGYATFPLPPTSGVKSRYLDDLQVPNQTQRTSFLPRENRDSSDSFLDVGTPDSPREDSGKVGAHLHDALTNARSEDGVNSEIPTRLRQVERLSAARHLSDESKGIAHELQQILPHSKAGHGWKPLNHSVHDNGSVIESASAMPEFQSKASPVKDTSKFDSSRQYPLRTSRHISASSTASSSVFSQLSRQFSLSESVSTRPSTLYSSSDCNQPRACPEDSLPLKVFEESRIPFVVEEDVRSVDGVDGAANESVRTQGNNEASRKHSGALRKSRKHRDKGKDKSRKGMAPIPPLAPERSTSLNSQKILCKNEVGLGQALNSNALSKRPFLGKWLEENDRVDVDQSTAHERFARELIEHLKQQPFPQNNDPDLPREKAFDKQDFSMIKRKDPILRRLKSVPRALQSRMRRESEACKSSTQMPLLKQHSQEIDSLACHSPKRTDMKSFPSNTTPLSCKTQSSVGSALDQYAASVKRSGKRPSLQLDRLQQTREAEDHVEARVEFHGRRSADAARVLAEDNVKRFMGTRKELDSLDFSQSNLSLAGSLKFKHSTRKHFI